MPDEFELRFPDSEVAPVKRAGSGIGREANPEFDAAPPDYVLAPAEGKSPDQIRAEVQAELKAKLGSFEETEPPDELVTQFSLRELMQIVFFCAIAFSVLRIVPSDLFAGLLGLATFGGLALLTITKPQKMIFYLGWWTLLGIYVISSVIAVITKNG
jgi:hypothetical protein